MKSVSQVKFPIYGAHGDDLCFQKNGPIIIRGTFSAFYYSSHFPRRALIEFLIFLRDEAALHNDTLQWRHFRLAKRCC